MPEPLKARWMPRPAAARYLSEYYLKVSQRTLERWPVAAKKLNGRAHIDMAAAVEHAERLIEAAPAVMQRSRRSPGRPHKVAAGAANGTATRAKSPR